jgi:hypothetical protein
MPGHEDGHDAGPVLLDSLDLVWTRVRDRLSGLGADEYLWEPAPGCWSVRAAPGGWRIERPDPEPFPPPVTTIAWRLWHLGSECLAGYTAQGLGRWPLAVRGLDWYPEPEAALAALDQAWQAFRAGLAQLGEEGLWRPRGPLDGEFPGGLWAAVVLRAQDELSHHGAEIALLRDLYVVQREPVAS